MSSNDPMVRLKACIRRGDTRGALQIAVALQSAAADKAAHRAYRAILAAWPGQPDALNGTAMLLSASGRHGEALGLLADLCRRHPEHPGLYMNRGTVEASAGQLEAAVASFERAIALLPRYADPYHSLCDILLQLGRPDDAVAACDRAMGATGRDFHALAFKAHVLRDAGRADESAWLLDHSRYVRVHEFDVPHGFADMRTFNTTLARHVRTHPTLRAHALSTEHGKHTGELLAGFDSPMEPLRETINSAVRTYLRHMPDDPAHPMSVWRPTEWTITSWGVVMFDRGHERAHIHPKGWLSGVLYLQLPGLIDDPQRRPEGWLEFGRPTRQLHVRTPPELIHYQPRYGAMFLFPSYFYHGTVPFRSEERRICVAFDIEPAG